jgi:hypothetical protein
MVPNMHRYLYTAVTLELISVAIPLHAANKPHAGRDRQSKVLWTNDDLDKLHGLGLISVVGRVDEERPASASPSATYPRTQDSDWYVVQAAALRAALEYRQAQLRQYRQAIDNARTLRESTGGIDLAGEDFAITPEAGIEILQQRADEAQTGLEALEDLARRNDIPPGTLRGQ